MVMDIPETRLAEEELRHDSERFQLVSRATHDAVRDWDLRTNDLWWNENFQKLFGYRAEAVEPGIASWTNRIHTEDLDRVVTGIHAAIDTGKLSWSDQYRFRCQDGSYLEIHDRGYVLREASGNPVRMISAMQDITERKRAAERLNCIMADLERSNRDLEQFAYVASHDLQEPLRMVSSYTQLLAQRYEGQLDDKAKKYIDYAVDGAIRMQQLINDLLTYSRVGTRGKPPEPTDSHAVLGRTLSDLAAMIKENQALVTNDDLPTVRADPSQLAEVFQNLIANAIKFRGENMPRVHVSASESDNGYEWVFSVKDNGIGIEPRYQDRLFVIFRRLHTRKEYPGTGIGLAICKRIVERHGGRIWFESEPGKGSTFYFTIPK